MRWYNERRKVNNQKVVTPVRTNYIISFLTIRHIVLFFSLTYLNYPTLKPRILFARVFMVALKRQNIFETGIEETFHVVHTRDIVFVVTSLKNIPQNISSWIWVNIFYFYLTNELFKTKYIKTYSKLEY